MANSGVAQQMIALVADPRIGLSTAYVVPAMVNAPGAVLTMSNKRDVLDAIYGLRQTAGRVWASDARSIALEALT